MANPDLLEILEATLRVGPATVLTTATLFSPQVVGQLASMRDVSIYSLELRVSMDGFSPETDDPIRGPGTFKRIMRGIKLLPDGGFLPIITAMRSWPLERDEAELTAFTTSLSDIGYRYPRIKLLPSLKIGQEALRRGLKVCELPLIAKRTNHIVDDRDLKRTLDPTRRDLTTLQDLPEFFHGRVRGPKHHHPVTFAVSDPPPIRCWQRLGQAGAGQGLLRQHDEVDEVVLGCQKARQRHAVVMPLGHAAPDRFHRSKGGGHAEGQRPLFLSDVSLGFRQAGSHQVELDRRFGGRHGEGVFLKGLYRAAGIIHT